MTARRQRAVFLVDPRLQDRLWPAALRYAAAARLDIDCVSHDAAEALRLVGTGAEDVILIAVGSELRGLVHVVADGPPGQLPPRRRQRTSRVRRREREPLPVELERIEAEAPRGNGRLRPIRRGVLDDPIGRRPFQ